MELKFKHFIILNILDVILTWYAFTQMTGLYELNPILSPIFQKIGLINGLILSKSVLLMVLYGLIHKIPLEIKIKQIYNIDGRALSLRIICFMFIFVVANNIYQILRLL